MNLRMHIASATRAGDLWRRVPLPESFSTSGLVSKCLAVTSLRLWSGERALSGRYPARHTVYLMDVSSNSDILQEARILEKRAWWGLWARC